MALLEIESLQVEFPIGANVLRAVDDVSLSVDEGEVLGIVGESGSGKSVTMLALMGLVAYPGRVRAQANELRRPRSADAQRARAAADDRARYGDDLSGARDQPEPVLLDRIPADRDVAQHI